MKKIQIYRFFLLFVVSFITISTTLPAQEENKEYLLMRVFYRTKNNSEIISKMSVVLGTIFPSLSGKIENGDNGTIKVVGETGQILVLHNEVDFFNYMASIGWKLHSSYPIRISDRNYMQHIFVKEE